ncbi:MAG: hypothetical protein JO246_11090 [Frankiaceae bacterium]|nr:hypothetical protein [Frankiaceae bacterium]MBV9871277.1 hypothetical protein [Frankiaceae bacterium]
MEQPSFENLLGILQDHFNPREEGWLWVATFMDGAEGGVVNQIEGDYGEPIRMADSLAYIINGCGADRAHLALCRRGGRPREVDREFWRRLRDQIDADVLQDMIVFDRRGTWSMRGEDEGADAFAV